ncbi:S-layer homology domain-containing protein [Domibacillus sp. DTU_2020_1001157_1_SI_ALB_TIR_016]|uniref:S-layer homology domain-containing protein n=1 Tax=Domibacillus sp. DTU_2020_1001157_1_SI_ALB_TIR_016 TaxID=3077789 RepID=UPI0028E8FEC3|nr:S-layer homology domain-containing protein [Domibacillus sp. DTU_2020_1001157_1_SI_ALB_TIR_016]WNS79531.1 S-layer homology domain-containing protein [Domibacillus sp. DTU_2020_1001157_1_SI_ALB_TIR_016]
MKKINITVTIILLFLSMTSITAVVQADTILPLNSTVSGSISEQEPMDAYTVSVDEAGVLSIDVNVYFSAALIELRDSNNALVGNFEGVFNGRPENPTSFHKDVNIEPGVYTVFVKDFNKTSFGNYDLKVVLDPAHNTEIEPNQTFLEAMPIQVNDKRFRGFISANDHEDYYKVELSEPGRLVVDVDSKMVNGSVDLYDSKGTMIFWDSLGFYRGLPLQWKKHADLEPGTYYISIRGNDFYQGIYEMLVSFTAANNEEIEPNNSKNTAMPIPLNDPKTYTGFLSYTDNFDYYKIDMKYDGYLTINFSSEFSSYQLTNETGIVYDSHVSSGSVGDPETSSRKTALPKGTYYFIPAAQVLWQGGVYTMSFKPETNFKDVTARYSSAVIFLLDKEVTNGLSKDKFGINDNIKRVDAAIWLAKILDLDITNSMNTPYSDLPKRAWGAVNALKEANIVNGKSSSYFGGNDSMTRGEMALLLQRAYKLNGDDAELSFTDVSPRYEEAVKALVKNNVTQGKSSTQFGTSIPITRGEMALFLHRAETTK